MSSTIVGRGLKIEVALTFDSVINPTTVTKAGPPVVTLNAHTLADGDVGYWSITAGMEQLHEQAFMVDNKATNTWEMPGFETTLYDTYTTGGVYMADTWGTLTESADLNISDAQIQTLPDPRLVDIRPRSVPGQLSEQSASIRLSRQVVDTATLQFVAKQARAGGAVLVKCSDRTGAVLAVFYGYPGLPGINVAAGGLASGGLTMSIPNWVVQPNVG